MDIEVSVESGRLRGSARSGHQAFLGVPFARAPLDGLRFAPPEPAVSWSGVRDAVAYGASAPQAQRVAMMAPGPYSEDCLFLNVFTPRADRGRRPVLVWIHGGGFVVGSASQPIYDGGPLAERGDVVVVTLNYRLGALGYLYVAGSDPAQPVASNAGQLDQTAALRWVRDNIATFGGDPEQVTIFGESAGSVAVCALLTMPAAKGLFVRAIAQSGTANRALDTDTATGTAHALTQKLGLSGGDLAGLRALALPELMRAQDALSTAPGLFSPVVDGATLPERPLTAVRQGQAREIPLLIGTNRDETKFYIDPKRAELSDEALATRVRGLLPRKAAQSASELIAAYRSSRTERGLPSSNNDLLDAVDTGSRFWIPTTRLAEAQSQHQPATYAYLFDWESPARRGALGACHALELPFMFGTLATSGMHALTGAGPEAEQLSARMMDAWLAFAKTGDPSCEALGPWPGYDARERKTMILGKRCGIEAAPFESERLAWHALL
jgi:para-nitrobenzyl esterase